MKRKKQVDLFVLILLTMFGGMFAYATRNLYIGRALLACAEIIVPGIIYLSLREPKNWKKITVATLVFGGLFGFAFDFIAEFNNAYNLNSILLPIRLFGVLPVDNIFGHMLMTAMTVIFYEHFINHERRKQISKNLIYAVLPTLFVIGAIVLAFYFDPDLLHTNYPYFYMGIAAILPPLFLAYQQPQMIRKMAVTAIYFFFLYLAVELVAVSLQYWIYPGNNYIGWVSIFNITFPFEELFFWMLFYAASLVSYYELFIDDQR